MSTSSSGPFTSSSRISAASSGLSSIIRHLMMDVRSLLSVAPIPGAAPGARLPSSPRTNLTTSSRISSRYLLLEMDLCVVFKTYCTSPHFGPASDSAANDPTSEDGPGAHSEARTRAFPSMSKRWDSMARPTACSNCLSFMHFSNSLSTMTNSRPSTWSSLRLPCLAASLRWAVYVSTQHARIVLL